MRQRRVLVRQAAAFAFGEMDAMGEHAAFADQAGAMIDVQVVLRLGKQHGEDRLELACRRALSLGACSYKSLESILRQGLESLPLAQTNLPLLPDDHANLRGPGYYH